MTLYDAIVEWSKSKPELNWNLDTYSSNNRIIFCTKCHINIGLIDDTTVALSDWPRVDNPPPVQMVKYQSIDPEFFNKLQAANANTHPCDILVKLYSPPSFTLAS